MLENQATFARRLGVSKQAVGGYLKNAQIKGAALVPSGKRILIDVDVALEQLRGNLDPYQRLCNGKAAIGKRNSVNKGNTSAGDPLSNDAAMLMAVIRELPSTAAWDVAVEGGDLQACFDIFANLRMNTISEMRRRGFTVEETDIEDVNWPGLCEEIGLNFIDPGTMHADWDRRRTAPD